MFAKVFLLLITALSVLALSQLTIPSPHTGTPDFAAIDAYVAAEMHGDRVPGIALAIVHNQQIAYLRGYGEDGNGRAVTPETGFLLGSMSKAFTALAVMQLVERGAIALDTPAQRYLPWFRVADPAASATITVRQLLNHTSGIPTRAPQAEDDMATLQDHVRALAQVTLSHPPGSKHEYASPNYLVLGAIIEEVTGQTFADYIQQQIFAPLDMQDSFTNQEQALQYGMAQGHRYWFGFPVATTLAYEQGRMPTAALISSANDLAHFLIAQLNQGNFMGNTLLSAAGMAEMHRPTAPAEDFAYAMGWRVGPVAGLPAIHHGGIVPHFRGKMVLLPEQGWAVAVLTNASTSVPLPITPTSHRMADSIAAYLAGQPLRTGSYTLSTAYLLFTIGMALVLLNQISGLIRIGRWRSKLTRPLSGTTVAQIAIEFLWPLLIIFGLPYLLGLPWREIMRSTPDLGAWLVACMALGLLTGIAKVIAVRR